MLREGSEGSEAEDVFLFQAWTQFSDLLGQVRRSTRDSDSLVDLPATLNFRAEDLMFELCTKGPISI